MVSSPDLTLGGPAAHSWGAGGRLSLVERGRSSRPSWCLPARSPNGRAPRFPRWSSWGRSAVNPLAPSGPGLEEEMACGCCVPWRQTPSAVHLHTRTPGTTTPWPCQGRCLAQGPETGVLGRGCALGCPPASVTPGLALRSGWRGCRTSSWSIMAKWVRFPPNQGPDPSLAYRPELDGEAAKDKGSFRNYTVRTHSVPTPSSLCSSPLEPRPHPPPSCCPRDAQGHTCEARPGGGGKRGAGQAWLTLRLAVRPAPGPRLRHLQAHAHAADGGLRQEEGTGRLLGRNSEGAERDWAWPSGPWPH